LDTSCTWERLVKRRRCSACGRLFQPCAKVHNQQYCPDRSCRKERKRRWQRKKLAEDPDYKANQREARKRWRAKHPDYWRDYRERHPEYVRRNRELQGERNRRRERIRDVIAKMDVINVRIDVIPRC
jgi:hypothetical protein